MGRMNTLDMDGRKDGIAGGGQRRRWLAVGGTVLVAASAAVVGVALWTADRDAEPVTTPAVLSATLESAPAGSGTLPASGVVTLGDAGVPAAGPGSLDPSGTLPSGTLPSGTHPVGPPALAAGETYYGRGESLYLAGDVAGAARYLAVESERHPDRFQPSYLLGLALRRDGRAVEAIAALENAARIDPASVRARINLARALCDAGRHEEALSVVAETPGAPGAAGPEPSGPGPGADGWNVRGRALLNLGRLDEAIGAFEAAIAIEPKDAWALNNLGYALITAGRFSEAVAPLESAVAIRSEVGLFHNNLGMAYERTARFAEALAAYRRAVEQGAGDRAMSNEERLSAATDLLGRTAERDDVSVDAAAGLLDE